MKKQNWSAVDQLFWVGAALISTGAGILSLSWGLFAAGAFCILGGVLIDLSGRAARRGEEKG